MRKETKKLVKHNSAFTLVELILVVGTIAIVAGALVGLVINSYDDFKFGSDRSTLLQDGQAAMEQMVRTLRQAQAFSAVSPSTDQAGDITFTNVDGITEQFRLNAQTKELEYGEPGSLSALAGSVSSLFFTCYDIKGDKLTGSVPTGSIQSVQIKTTLTDGTNSFTLSSRAFLHKDFQSVVINEFMYNPPGNKDKAREWVELYNLTDDAVDVTGWTIYTNNPAQADPITVHPQFGSCSTTIPANGYAVITAETTEVYDEQVTNGGFEDQDLSAWEKHNSWERKKWSAHSGKWKLRKKTSGSAWLYQDIRIPNNLNSCLFVFWEMTTASVAQTQITVTLRRWNNHILATGYSGQMHSDWTCHKMDLTAYAGRKVRIYFETTKNTNQGVLLLDDVSVASSFVDADATRLSVDDDRIGSGLANNNGTIVVTDGSATVDSVTYDDGWGGDGNGKSLARIDPQGGSNDPDNWQEGPVNGTPGSAN